VGIGYAERVTVFHVRPQIARRSAYLQQVRRIAPPDPPGLIGRETELAELAEFCVQPGRGPYAWWRADAWAGKSALLSTFVLRPPPEIADRLQIVSFFVTARLAAQDTREAFAEVLLEQLAELTGQDLPTALPEATRDAYLLDLLEQAATACQDMGRRLVLVVDGLDEDQSATTGPHAHSIAGLLPASPPAGMRVIVAGRPNPPIPDDVQGWHPLRDPRIVRPLAESPHAQDVARLGRQELHRLLHGSRTEQDLLGLLTAARGGLSGPDLEELTGTPVWDIEQILHTVTGRTFTRRTSRWMPETAPHVYLLGHEELQSAAARYLGGQRLAGYHDRLHHWADTYCEHAWPPGSPEYLLSGYYRLLIALRDIPRVVACAADPVRHNRMLDLTGGDAAALAEARSALNLIAAEDSPNLGDALLIACHRDQLTERNANIPVLLPAVWATLGWAIRAEALAASITDPDRQACALAYVARALAVAGEHQEAAAVAEQAEIVARSIVLPGRRGYVVALAVSALARAGKHRQAETVARSITHTDRQADALAVLAEALAQAGEHNQAETVARSMPRSDRQANAIAQIVKAMASAGQYQQAQALAQSITDPYQQANAFAQIAEAMASAGQYQQAEVVARSMPRSDRQAQAIAQIATALADAGDTRSASRVAAAACTAGSWTIAARPVLRLAPSAATKLARILEDDQKP
jgi:tetratricopeptide (TPR) repeat protein